MFAAVILNSGLSFANGSGARSGDLKFGKPALAGEDSPPSQAGMLPSALPAFSPPSGVGPRRAGPPPAG